MSEVLDFRTDGRKAPVDSINLKFHPRERLSPERIEMFVDLLQSGQVFDPIKVARQSAPGILYLIDGRYRLEAYKRNNLDTIEYDLVKVKEAFWLLASAKFNSCGPEQLTYVEMKKIILTSHDLYGLDPNEIHEYLKNQCSLRWVYKVIGSALKCQKAKTREKIVEMRKRVKSSVRSRMKPV